MNGTKVGFLKMRQKGKNTTRITFVYKVFFLLSKECVMETIPAEHVNKRGLVQLRNELSHYIKTSLERVKPGTCDFHKLKSNVGVIHNPQTK